MSSPAWQIEEDSEVRGHTWDHEMAREFERRNAWWFRRECGIVVVSQRQVDAPDATLCATPEFRATATQWIGARPEGAERFRLVPPWER